MFHSDSVIKLIEGRETAVTQTFYSVETAIKTMEDHNVNAVGVKMFSGLFGIFTRSDYIERVLRCDLSPSKTMVFQVATRHPYTIHPSTNLYDAYDVMLRKHINHLPVMTAKNGRFMGIVTEKDLRHEIYKPFYAPSIGNKLYNKTPSAYKVM